MQPGHTTGVNWAKSSTLLPICQTCYSALMENGWKPLPWADELGAALAQRRASDNAEHYLRSLIFSGRLGPDDRLPPERELATQLGIARITLRAAIRSLETAGFIVVKIGSKGGPRVNNYVAISDCWRDWMQKHKHQLDEMLEFRRLISTRIASCAAERRTPEDLQALEQGVRGSEENRDSIAQWHLSFHDALATAAHNDYLRWADLVIRGDLFQPADKVVSEKKITEILGLHSRILDAIRDQDPDRAAEEMRAHLEHSERIFETYA